MKTKTFLFMLLMSLASLSACVSPTAQPTVQTPPTATPSALAAIDLGTIGHGWAKTAAWSADGKTLAVASSRGIYLYDTVTWQTFKSIPLQDDEYFNGVTQLWFSLDGQSLVYTYVSSPQLSIYRYSLMNDQVTQLYPEILFSELTTFVFSADGKTFANIGVTVLDENDKPKIQPQVEIREVVSGNVLQTLNTDMEWWGRFNPALAAFSPDGTLFATGDVDNNVQAWDVETGTLLFKQNHEANIESITFSPDGKMLVSTGDDAAVRFWEARTGRSLYVLRKFTRGLVYVSYSMNGHELLLGISDGSFQRWTTNEQFLPVVYRQSDFKPDRYEFTREPASQYLNLAGDHLAIIHEANLQIFDLAAGAPPVTLSEFNSFLSLVEFSPDGNLLALIDRKVHLWDLDSRRALGTLQINRYDATDIAFAPNGNQIAVAASDIQIWDVNMLKKVREMNAGINQIAYSPDGQLLAGAGWDDVTIWDPDNGELIQSLESNLGTPIELAFNSDGSRLTMIAQEGAKTWDLSSGRLLWSLDQERLLWSPDQETRIVNGALVYSSNRAMVENFINCINGSQLDFLDLENGQLLYSLNLPFCGHGYATVHSAKRLLAYVSSFQQIYKITLSDLDSGKSLLDIETSNKQITSLHFRPDGKILAAEEWNDAVVRLLDISSVSSLAASLPAMTATPLPTHTPTPSPTPAIAEEIPLPLFTPPPTNPNAITADNVSKLKQIGTLGGAKYISDPRTATWSEDGKFFALGTLGAVYVYKTGSNSLWQSFASGKLVEDLVFSPDGHFLVEQNHENEVIVWDLPEGKRVYTFEKECWRARVIFSADNFAITLDCPGTISQTFDLGTGTLISQKKSAAYGSLNQEGNLSVYNDSYYTYLTDVQSTNILHVFESRGRPWHSSFSPDGQTILVSYYNVPVEEIVQGEKQTVYQSIAELWQAIPGQGPILRRKIVVSRISMEIPPPGETFVFSPDGKYLFTTVWDGIVHVWDTSTGDLVSELPGGYQVFPSADHRWLLTFGPLGRVQIWDLTSIRNPKLLQTLSDFESSNLLCPLFFTSGGKEIIINAGDRIEKWKTAQLSDRNKSISYPVDDQVKAFAASLNGSSWATVTSDNTIVLRDPKTGNVLQTLSRGFVSENNLDDQITNLLFSNSGEVLVASTYWHIWVWNLKSAESPQNIEPDFSIGEWVLSPDGRLLAISENEGGKAEIWDIQTGKRLRRFDFAGGQIAFAPDGLTLATGWRDGRIWLLDVRSGQMFRAFQAEGYLWDITFNTDGSLLVAKTGDQLEFWDVARGQHLTTIDTYAECTAFSPDGAIFATCFNDDRIQLWSLTEK